MSPLAPQIKKFTDLAAMTASDYQKNQALPPAARTDVAAVVATHQDLRKKDAGKRNGIAHKDTAWRIVVVQ